MNIINKDEIDAWLFEHANVHGHMCYGVKGIVRGFNVNVAYVDTQTNERIEIVYDDN